MLSQERQQAILDLIDETGAVEVTVLVTRFGVSEMTIRRDLDILESRSLLRRVHGGAVSDRGRSYEPPFHTRSLAHRDEKERIGRAAAALVQNGDSLILDVGTTTLEVARNLLGKQNLTILTACLQIGSLLAANPGIHLVISGGILRPGELSMVGHLAERVFNDFYVDRLFLGAAGIDLHAGLTEFNLEDTLVKKAMMRNAKEIILVADASKFNRIAFTSIAPLSAVNKIITNREVDPAVVSRLEEQGIELILA